MVDINAFKKGGKSQKISDFDYCGHNHDKGNCPVYSKTCNTCGMKNHFEKKCRQNDSKSRNRPRSKGDHDHKCKTVVPQEGRTFMKLAVKMIVVMVVVMATNGGLN